jgi:RNA polymerase sigma-54 factor
MDMRIEHRLEQKLSQELRVTPQMILINRILQLQRLDLKQEIELNLKENPALELVEEALCPKCGEPLGEGGACRICESDMEYTHQDSFEFKNRSFDDLVSNWDSGHFEDASTYEKPGSDDDFDPLTNTPEVVDIPGEIKRNYVTTYSSSSEEIEKAVEYMIELIDDKGLLQVKDSEIADELGLDIEMVKEVRDRIMHLDPIGLGAYSPSDALIVQLEVFEISLGRDLSLEKLIVTKYRDLLARESIERIAQGTNMDIKRVREASEFIRENLYAYPGDFFEKASTSELDPDFYPEPDVIIREVNGEYYPEIVDSGLPNFRISTYYIEAYHKIKNGDGTEFTEDEKKHIRQYFERAKFFLDCINQRRETVTRICNFLIKYQKDFLKGGIRKLKDLTREKVAEEIGFHPSTISRALKDKYVQLPDRSIHSFSIFFDYQKVLILTIREILNREETAGNCLSDDEISDRMKALGFDVARRTVAKYRERGKIPPKNIRKRKLVEIAKKPDRNK